MRKCIWEKGLLTLFLFFLCSCSSSNRQWEFVEADAVYPSYPIGKLHLPAENTYSCMEIEVTQGRDGIRMYANVFSLPLIPADCNDRMVLLTYVIDDITYTGYVFALEGGQRVLFPDEIAQQIISALLDNQKVSFKLGRYSTVVVPYRFQEKYQQLFDGKRV